MSRPETSISIRGVSKNFGATQAVRALDLDVPRGSLCGFLGPNGAGKSTTIRMIMSIIYPDTGSIDVLGSSALKNKDRIGYLPEERGVYRKMRVEDVSFMMDGEIWNWGWADYDFEWNVDAGFAAYPHGWRYYHGFRHPRESANMLYFDGHVGTVYHFTKTGKYLFNYKFP